MNAASANPAPKLNPQARCEPLISAKEAAVILDISATKVKRMAAAGELPALQLGNRWKFRASWLDEWLNSRIDLARHPRPSPVEIK